MSAAWLIRRLTIGEWLNRNVTIAWTLVIIASQGSGENLERAEYLELVERTAEFDLVLTEDLGRICRRVHAHVFCENAIDVQTRVVAINDRVDTEVDGWELSSYFTVMRHEAYNKDTNNRIRRSLRNRFTEGGVVQCLPYGYIKPHPKATDAECHKNPDAEPIYREWFKRLEGDERSNTEPQSYAEVADWLNSKKVDTGTCRQRNPQSDPQGRTATERTHDGQAQRFWPQEIDQGSRV
jgi:site-specific DNA recombinase